MKTPTAIRAHKCAMARGWHMPQLLPVLSHCDIIDGEPATCPTMQIKVRPDGATIEINPTFAATLTDEVLGGVMAHELLHMILLHTNRRNGRDPKRWNRAADRAINSVLRAGKVKLTAEALYPPAGMEDATAEALYAVERPEDDGEGKAAVAAGCGPEADPSADGMPGDDGESGDGQKPATAPGSAPHDVWREVAAQARAMGRGTQAGKLLARLLEPPAPRTRFERVLRSAASGALSVHGRDDQTWTRRNRRSPPDVILPGWAARRAKVAVVIDSSGSVSDAMLARAASETLAIQKAVEGLRIFLVVHDSIVHHAAWLRADSAAKVQKTFTRRGGTEFFGAYRAVDEAGRFDACVHLTDGEIGRWPDPPHNARRFIVARLGTRGDAAPTGAIDIPVEI